MLWGLFFATIITITWDMKWLSNIIIFKIIFIFSFLTFSYSIADNHNIYETLEQIQRDIKTLEKAVYSSSSVSNDNTNSSNLGTDSNSEDVLTRHLLKLSEIESQFQQLC